MTGRKTLNLVLKKMLKPFLKIQENIRISILDKLEKTNKQKVLNLVLTLDDGSWRAKNAPKISSNYLMDRICKKMKNSTPRRELPKLQLLNFLAKFLTGTKIE